MRFKTHKGKIKSEEKVFQGTRGSKRGRGLKWRAWSLKRR